eukprot:621850-Amphidinium_carterae.1
MIPNTATIQRDRFSWTAAVNDTNEYLWFTWLTESQYEGYIATRLQDRCQATRTLVETMSTNTTGSTIVQTIVSIYTSTQGGMQQWTIRTM